MARFFEFESDKLPHNGVDCDRSAQRFPAVAQANPFGCNIDHGSQVRCGLIQNLIGRLLRVHRNHFRKQAGNIRHTYFTGRPRADNVRYGPQTKLGGNAVRKLCRGMHVERAKRLAHGFAADPKPAAFIAKVRPPTADSEHVATFIAPNHDRARTGNQQNAGIYANGADRCNKRVTFDDDLSPGNERFEDLLVKGGAVRTRCAGEPGAHNVWAFPEVRYSLSDSLLCGVGTDRQPIRRTGLDMTDFVVVLVNEEESGFRASSINSEIPHYRAQPGSPPERRSSSSRSVSFFLA